MARQETYFPAMQPPPPERPAVRYKKGHVRPNEPKPPRRKPSQKLGRFPRDPVTGRLVISDSALARFWKKVDRKGPDDCWPWTAGKNHFGHGRFRVGGRHEGHSPAHQIAYEIEVGPIPDGLWGLHKCNFAPCCNPAHIYPGDVQDNSDDCTRSGRRRLFKDGDHPKTKHAHLYDTIRSSPLSGTELADKLGIPLSVVSGVRTGSHFKIRPKKDRKSPA